MELLPATERLLKLAVKEIRCLVLVNANNDLFMFRSLITFCGLYGSTCAFTPTSTCLAKYLSLRIVIFMATGGTQQTSTSFGAHGTYQFTDGPSGILIYRL